jgi:hypothetical protein
MEASEKPTGSMLKPLLAGMAGAVLALGLIAALAFWLIQRKMAGGCCADRMRECMQRCGCGPARPED